MKKKLNLYEKNSFEIIRTELIVTYGFVSLESSFVFIYFKSLSVYHSI